MLSMVVARRGLKAACWTILILIVSAACQVAPPSPQVQPGQPPPASVPASFTGCHHSYEGVWYCTRENGRYRVLYADLSNPAVRADVAMAGYSTDPQDYVVETVEQIAQRYADRFPGLQVVAGINANYFGPGHHGPQGLVKATTRERGSPSGQYTALFSPYLNSETHDGVARTSSLGISTDGRLLIDPDFYNQHADFIGGHTGDGRALTAGPAIVWHGDVLPEDRFVENCTNEGLPSVYCTQPRPRAAVGITGQHGLVLSVGQQDMLRNTALLLQQHGVEYAMKLDDGSSAQLWYVDDPFVPAGGGGAVANALLIYSRPVGERPAVATSATVLLIDVSGSMEQAWRGGVKIESAKQAAIDVTNMIQQESQIGESSHQVAVTTFTNDAQLEMGLTTDYDAVRQTVNGLAPLDRTNIGAGLQVANQALTSATTGAQKIIILLSDGLTNEGLLPSQILAGPVQEAAMAGTCIYTVGFGEAGDLDEDLLRQIAERSGCGTYTYASAPSELERVYVRLRHQSLGTVLAEFDGQVAQGETADIGPVEVSGNQGEMYITLQWPGSDLDLIVTDPRGRPVDENYPGVSLAHYERLVYLIIQNPIPGTWLLQTFGADVPEEILNFVAIVSVRERTGPPPINLGPVLLALGLITLAVIAAVLIVTQQQRLAPASVRVVRGPAVRFSATFRGGRLMIGRDPHCELVLPDPQVSARHAQIQRTPQGYVLTDLGSKNGTFVNGQQIQQALLRGGERLRVGQTELVFASPAAKGAPAPSVQTPPGAAMVHLAVMAGDQEFARYPVTPGTVLGRYTGCPVDLSADALVSRQHARLDYREGEWVITDLESGNGTFVNGQQVTSQLLRHGDEIQLGRTRMRFLAA